MKLRLSFKCICLVFIICIISIQCQTSLIQKRKKNGIVIEKINIEELDKYISRKRKPKNNQKINYLNIRKDDSLNNASFKIIERIEGKIKLLSVSKKEGKYTNIQKIVYHNDYREIISFNPDGNLKSKVLIGEKEILKNSKFGEIGLINKHVGISVFYDIKGDKIAEYNYENLYKFKLSELISYLEKNYSKQGELAINKLFLSEFTIINVNEILKGYNKQNIPLKKEHPYWTAQFVYKKSRGLFSKVIFIDGLTGEKIAEQVTGPVISVD